MASKERIQMTRKAGLPSFGDLPCVKMPCCLVGMLLLCRSTFCTEMQQYSSFQCACYSSRSGKANRLEPHSPSGFFFVPLQQNLWYVELPHRRAFMLETLSQ